MRRLFFNLFAFATVAVALAACSKETDQIQKENPSKKDGFIMTVKTAGNNTKTVIDDPGTGTSYAIKWQSSDQPGEYSDQLGVYEVANEEVQGKAESNSTPTLNNGGETATFAFTLQGQPAGPYKYAFVNPSSALNYNTQENQYTVTIQKEQTFQENSFDPAADLLVSRLIETNTRPETVTAEFGRIGATARMVVKCPTTTETIQSITFSTTEGNISGDYLFNPVSGSISNEIVSGQNSVVLTPKVATPFTGEVVVWFRLAAITLSNDFTVAVTTDKNVYTKTVDLDANSKTLNFEEGKLTKFSVNFEDITGESIIIFSTPFYADISSNTTYVSATHGDLGVIGSSKSTITYTFDGEKQLRNNNNKISDDAASFYWCSSSTGLTIDGINVGTNQYFNLAFDRKVPSGTATLSITISNDGTHFFPVTSTETVSITGTTASNNNYNFSIPSGEYTNLKIRFENSGSGASIDNVTLTKLAEAGASNTAVSFDVVAVDPTLVVTPSPVNLLEGATQQLTVTGTNGTISYESNDTRVATVSSTGLITAVAEGSTTIDITSTATEDYNAGATSVTVNVSAGLSFETVVITESWSADLKNATGNNAKFVDDGQYIWTVDATYGHKAANNATAASFYSPKFDMSSVDAGTITFAHTGNVTGDSYQSLGKAYYTLDDGSSWTQISLTNPTSNWSWQTASISSAVYAGETIQFRWDFQGNASKTWEVKDFVITVPDHSITVNDEASPLTVELNGDATKSTTLKIASGYAWSVKSTTGQPANYTYTKDSDTQITVTPAADNTSGSTNSGIGTMVLTDGTVDFTITFDQANKSTTGGEETMTFSDLYNSNTTLDGTSIDGTNFSVLFNKRNGGTATQYYTNGTAVRWYGGGTLTISAASGKTITGITINFTTHANSVSANVGDYTDGSANGSGTWSGSAEEIVFTQSGTSGHDRITSITVEYE